MSRWFGLPVLPIGSAGVVCPPDRLWRLLLRLGHKLAPPSRPAIAVMLAAKDAKLGQLGKRYGCASAPCSNRFIPLKRPVFTNLLVCQQGEVAECLL